MRKIRYSRPGIPVLSRRAWKELKAMPAPDDTELRREAEECKKRILAARKKEKGQEVRIKKEDEGTEEMDDGKEASGKKN